MSKSNKSINQIESRIENMLDKLIESDEDSENNGERPSLKFSDDISSSEVGKEDEEPFEKELFSIPFFQGEDNTQKKEVNSSNKKQNKININQNIPSNMNCIYNNYNYNSYNPYSFNCLYPNQINNLNNNNNIGYPFFNMFNKNINNNSNYINNDTISTSTSFSSNFDNNNIMPINSNKSLINIGYDNFNTSFNNEGHNFKFNRSQKSHNSFFAGDKNCFNKTFNNLNNNYNSKNNVLCNTNVELEILLIEANKILNKIEKIDQLFYNKLKGKFEQIICTHKGSRIFQNYLKNTHTDILHQIFLEIKNNLSKLLRDNYANYFCNKFFDSLNQKDRIEYLSIIQKDLHILAIDITATYPIQSIIEQLGSKAEKRIIYIGIKDSISTFCYNIYGTHVIEKILSYFEDDFTNEIIEYIYNNFIDLAYNINGICVVKKVLLMTHKKELHQKLKQKILENANNLIIHQYGNYVIQVIFENWDDNELEDILNHYTNKYIYLSKLKYSSNVIERIIEKNDKNLNLYINSICVENHLSELMLNNYGNYVIQKALKLSSGPAQDMLIQEIFKNLYIIKDKKIFNKWKMIISSKYT